ncbi:uncharacterized protein LOC110895278 [Helianthus annuus]|uniref:uncharacterized protein LOC110895278 n=1 Tax=Helianthus annuus TaxID=4232 RepID=UPI000B8F556A|nr:uncharacterized protein LOC110895278 [Helianthus annuus]
MGDFNVVRYPEDRLNSTFDPVVARLFNDFTENNSLAEFAMKGAKFTYFKKKGRKFSKLDRILVNQDFFDLWSDGCLTALQRFLSNHAPILLVTDLSNFGLVPFRFFNSWLEESDLANVISKALEDFQGGDGPRDGLLADKLKLIRDRIKEWVKGKKIKEGESKASNTADLLNVEGIMKQRDLTDEEEWVRAECIKNLAEFEDKTTKDIRQKSRVNWASFGDENSAFFHRSIKIKSASSKIHRLTVDGRWCNNPVHVKKTVHHFFRDRFKEPLKLRPCMSALSFKSISVEEATMLIQPFSRVEVKQAVWECGDDKAPGPTGFNFRFFKRFWNLFEEDFVKVMENFF